MDLNVSLKFRVKDKFCKAYLAGPRINLLCIPIKFICRIAAETKMLIRCTNLKQLCTHLFILL